MNAEYKRGYTDALKKVSKQFLEGKRCPACAENMEYKAMCWECGKKRYKGVNELIGITVSMGKCTECGEEKGIIPSTDWSYYEGNNLMWD